MIDYITPITDNCLHSLLKRLFVGSSLFKHDLMAASVAKSENYSNTALRTYRSGMLIRIPEFVRQSFASSVALDSAYSSQIPGLEKTPG